MFLAVVSGAVWLRALNVRTRRLYVLSLEERTTTLERERERERDAQARAAVAEERTRITRELHDVVAHSMAVMIVQADGATYRFDRDPAVARAAVKTVADTGREALEEMRRRVGVLRDPAPAGPLDPAAAELSAVTYRVNHEQSGFPGSPGIPARRWATGRSDAGSRSVSWTRCSTGRARRDWWCGTACTVSRPGCPPRWSSPSTAWCRSA
jgi:signal transduction histidine kinase